MSFTTTASQTFTITHARYISSKIKADLAIMRRHYGAPSEVQIDRFGEEAAMLLVEGYLDSVYYGFRKSNNEIVFKLEYHARSLSSVDDNPGQVPANVNIAGASFYSSLSYSTKWWCLTQAQRDAFEARLPTQRTTESTPPTLGSGIYVNTKSYSSNGQGVDRKVFRPL